MLTNPFWYSCQTYEGGFAGYPGLEAHGGYTFCGAAALMLLNSLHLCDLKALLVSSTTFDDIIERFEPMRNQHGHFLMIFCNVWIVCMYLCIPSWSNCFFIEYSRMLSRLCDTRSVSLSVCNITINCNSRDGAFTGRCHLKAVFRAERIN